MSTSTFQHLVEAKGPENDWTGMKDPKLRRRVQIRLHVRAHRKRKAKESRRRPPEQSVNSSDTSVATIQNARRTSHQRPNHLWYPNFTFLYMVEIGNLANSGKMTCPLSMDHLIPVIQFNLVRAMLSVMHILGIDDLFDGECEMYWSLMPKSKPMFPLPDDLTPTPLQLSVPHELWIDVFPHPIMRDNAIRATGTVNIDELENDLLGLVLDEKKSDFCPIMVWGDPWRADSYELSVEFLRKYGFLVKGCESLLLSTNKWRVSRGEPKIAFWG